METTENSAPNTNQQTRFWFLQQGQSIGHLHELLSSNVFHHHSVKWLSMFLEIALYLIATALVLVAILLPLDPDIHNLPPAECANCSQYYNDWIDLFRILTLLFSLGCLLFAKLLSGNRKKSRRIRAAFNETERMKKNFDEAIKTLRL